MATFAYLTGWRKQEILGLTRDPVDFDDGVVRLEVNTTKTDAGRVFPFGVLPELAELLAAQREGTRDLERLNGAIVPGSATGKVGESATTTTPGELPVGERP